MPCRTYCLHAASCLSSAQKAVHSQQTQALAVLAAQRGIYRLFLSRPHAPTSRRLWTVAVREKRLSNHSTLALVERTRASTVRKSPHRKASRSSCPPGTISDLAATTKPHTPINMRHMNRHLLSNWAHHFPLLSHYARRRRRRCTPWNPKPMAHIP